MKKILSVLLIALLVLAVLSVTGVLLFHHFVADQITDKGGMMNPDYMDGTDDVYMQDGNHTDTTSQVEITFFNLLEKYKRTITIDPTTLTREETQSETSASQTGETATSEQTGDALLDW